MQAGRASDFLQMKLPRFCFVYGLAEALSLNRISAFAQESGLYAIHRRPEVLVYSHSHCSLRLHLG